MMPERLATTLSQPYLFFDHAGDTKGRTAHHVVDLELCADGQDHIWGSHDEDGMTAPNNDCERCHRVRDYRGLLTASHPVLRNAGVDLQFLQLELEDGAHGKMSRRWAIGLYKISKPKGIGRILPWLFQPRVEGSIVIKPSRDGKCYRVLTKPNVEWTQFHGELWDLIVRCLGELSPGYKSRWGYYYYGD